METEKKAKKTARQTKAAKTEKTVKKTAVKNQEAVFENKALITKDTLISDVLKIDENLAETFFEFGMHCLGCPISNGESIAEASYAHGIDAGELIKALNERVKKTQLSKT